MSIPEIGIFSEYTVMLHQDVTGEPRSRLLKRAALLFERLLLVPRDLGDLTDTGNKVTRTEFLNWCADDEADVLPDLEQLIVLDSELFSNREAIYRELRTPESDDLWGGEHGDRYLAFVAGLAAKVIPEENLQGRLEVQKYLLGNIDRDIKLFKTLARHFPQCSGLYSEVHESALLATHDARTASADGTLRVLSDISMTDLSTLSWKEVFALRRNAFVGEFRKTLAKWTQDYASAPSTARFEQRIDTLFRDAMCDLTLEVEPCIPKSILGALIDYAPFPGPVNPIAAIKTALSIKHDLELKRRFGWMFFVQRARRRA